MDMGTPKKRYMTDLDDTEWMLIESFVRQKPGRGRKRTIATREVVNALFYLDYTGCQWEMLPKDLPEYHLVNYYHLKWTRDGTWNVVMDTVRAITRTLEDRKEEPTAAILDSQSVKTIERVRNEGLMLENASKGGNAFSLLIHWGYFCVSWSCVPRAPNQPAGLRSLMTSSNAFRPSEKCGPIVPMAVNLLIMCANGVDLTLRSSALPLISVDFTSNRNDGSLNVRLVGSTGGVV